MIKLEWNRTNGAKLLCKDADEPAYISFEKDDAQGHVLHLCTETVEQLEELTKAFELYYSYAQYYMQMNSPDMLQHGLNDLEGKGYIIDANYAGLKLMPKREGVTAQTKADAAYTDKITFLLSKVETDAQIKEILCSLGDAGGMAFMF